MNYRPDRPDNPTNISHAILAAGRTCPMVDHLLGPDGPLAHGMPGFQDRPGQRLMANCLRRAWKQDLPAITEAATGAGKSEAALVPSILRALETGKPVVVSTATTALQAQYLHEVLPRLLDLLTPWLTEKFGRTFSYAGLYGRGRYLCEKKFTAHEQPEHLLEWQATTEDGLLDLALSPQERRALTAEKSECPGARCAIAKEGGCWFYAARKRAFAADILVVNHALLVAAALAPQEGTVLPAWSALVVDEAHTLEEVARQALGVSFGPGKVSKLVEQALAFVGAEGHRQLALHDQVDRQAKPGKRLISDCIYMMLAVTANPSLAYAIQEGAHGAPQDLIEWVSGAPVVEPEPYRPHSPTLEGINHELAALFRSIENATRRDARDGTALLPALDTCAAAEHLDELVAQLRRLALDVDAAGDMHWEESEEAAQARVLQESLDALGAQLRAFRGGTPGKVAWVQMGREKQPPALHAQPVDVSGFLKDGLWKKAPAALSSATLATGQDFTYVEESLGIRSPHQVVVPSPFDWNAQCRLYLPEDGLHEGLLGIKARSRDERERCAEEYARVSSLHIKEVLRYTKGRAFLLFTSRDQLERTARYLRDMPWPYITQGEMGQADTIRWFTETPGAVLFALASYWEGVSVAGSALSCVWIDRLPIAPPTDLLQEARRRAQGGGVSAFKRVDLPQIIMRMKQGFGRLIRTVTDRGVACLPDPRLRTREYGRDILAALPPARRIDRAGLRHLPLFLAGAGQPIPGDPSALLALDPARMPPDHAAYTRQLQRMAPGGMAPGLWAAAGKLVSLYANVSERKD